MPEIEFDPNYNPFVPQSASAPQQQPTTQRRASAIGGDGFQTQRRVVDSQLNNWDKLYQNFEKKRSDSLEHVVAASALNQMPSTEESHQTSAFQQEKVKFTPSSCTQLRNKYILVPGANGIMLIDQHRAHIRVLFDSLINAVESKKIESQKVLFQEVIKLSTAQNFILDEVKPEMEKMGFEISFLGDCSWAVNAFPACLKNPDVKEMILDVADSAINGGVSLSKRISEHIALSSARAAAVRYGDRLTPDAMEALVADLFRSKEANYTPDGKKIICTVTFDDINKMFS